MAVGGGVPRVGVDSIMGVAEEVALGTALTATAFYPFNSESLVFDKPKELIDSFNGNRNFLQVFDQMGKVEGSVEFYYNPASDFCNFIIKQALGGTVTSSVAPTATAGYLHTFTEGNMEDNKSTSGAASVKGLTFSVRRGATNTGIWMYRGCRVEQLTITGELNRPVVMSADIVGLEGSVTTWSVPAIDYPDSKPMIFNGVTIQEAASIGSAGSSTADIFQSFEVVLKNNIAADEASGALGTNTMMVLPAARREVTLKLEQRYDTNTAWEKFIASTISAIQINMTSAQTITAITGSTVYSAHIELPFCSWDTVQPSIADPGIVTHEINAKAFAQNTTTNYTIRMKAYNNTATY